MSTTVVPVVSRLLHGKCARRYERPTCYHQISNIRRIEEKMTAVESPHQTGSSTSCQKSLYWADLTDIMENIDLLIISYFELEL